MSKVQNFIKHFSQLKNFCLLPKCEKQISKKRNKQKAIAKIDTKRRKKLFVVQTKNENEQIYYSLQSQNVNYLFTGSFQMRLTLFLSTLRSYLIALNYYVT